MTHDAREPELPRWSRPSATTIALARQALGPWRWLTAPSFHHLERVPRDRPVLFVANHTLMGVLDTPLLMLGLVEHTVKCTKCGRELRGQGHAGTMRVAFSHSASLGASL